MTRALRRLSSFDGLCTTEFGASAGQECQRVGFLTKATNIMCCRLNVPFPIEPVGGEFGEVVDPCTNNWIARAHVKQLTKHKHLRPRVKRLIG
jgi:hypothetical protein